jgi:hypothetical protein
VAAVASSVDVTCVLVDGPVDAVIKWTEGGDDVDALISSGAGVDRRVGGILVLHASPKR